MLKVSIVYTACVLMMLCGCSNNKSSSEDKSIQAELDRLSKPDAFSDDIPFQYYSTSGQIVLEKKEGISYLNYFISIKTNHEVYTHFNFYKDGKCRTFISQDKIETYDGGKLLISESSGDLSLKFEQFKKDRAKLPKMTSINNDYFLISLNDDDPNFYSQAQDCKPSLNVSFSIKQEELEANIQKLPTWLSQYNVSDVTLNYLKNSFKLQSQYALLNSTDNGSFIFNVNSLHPVGIAIPFSKFLVGRAGPVSRVAEASDLHPILLTSEDSQLRQNIQKAAAEIDAELKTQNTSTPQELNSKLLQQKILELDGYRGLGVLQKLQQ